MALDTLTQVLSVECCWVQTFNARKRTLHLAAERGFNAEMRREVAALQIDHDFGRRLIGVGNSLIIPDLSKDGHYGMPSFRAAGFKWMVAAPLLTYRIHGVLGMASRHKKSYRKETADLAMVIAGLIGAALNKADLSKDAQKAAKPEKAPPPEAHQESAASPPEEPAPPAVKLEESPPPEAHKEPAESPPEEPPPPAAKPEESPLPESHRNLLPHSRKSRPHPQPSRRNRCHRKLIRNPPPRRRKNRLRPMSRPHRQTRRRLVRETGGDRLPQARPQDEHLPPPASLDYRVSLLLQYGWFPLLTPWPPLKGVKPLLGTSVFIFPTRTCPRLQHGLTRSCPLPTAFP
jgi:outer membrane biosynthesis protein TonB